MWIYLPAEFCPSAPESGDSKPASEWRSQLLASSAALNTKHSPATSWLRAWKKALWLQRLFGRICTPSEADRGVERWIASWAAIRVSPSPKPESVSAPTIQGTSGQGSESSSSRSSRNGASSKTSEGTSPSASTSSTDSFESLVSTLKRAYSARKKWVQAIGGNGSSSSLWPKTPEASDGEGGVMEIRPGADGKYKLRDYGVAFSNGQWQTPATDAFRCRGGDRKDEMGLDQEARMWPTPNTAPESKQLGSNQKSSPPSLGEAVKQWPTPAASAPNVDEAPASWLARQEKLKEKGINGNGAGMPLGVASQLWATPRGRSTKGDTGSPERQTEGPNPGLNDQAATWATPCAHDGRRPGPEKDSTQGRNLKREAEGWPTPAARDYRSPNSKESEERRFSGDREKSGQQPPNFVAHSPSSPLVRVISVSGEELSPTDPSTASRRRLNPAFVCWLMGWNWWWTNPARNNFARVGMGSYLFKLRLLLASLLARHEQFLASESKVSRQSS